MITRDDKPKKILLSITDAAYALSVSPNHVRDLIAEGVLHKVNLGRRVLVTVASIELFISNSIKDKAAPLGRAELADADVAH
jgi:excisionase family DNA binding protein